MKFTILFVLILLFYRPRQTLSKLSFLNIPDLHKLHHMVDDKASRFQDQERERVEISIEEDTFSYTDKIVTNEELEEMRDTISTIDDYEVYPDGVYDPIENGTRRRKRSVTNDFISYLSAMVDNLDTMLKSTEKSVQEKAYKKALDLLDKYVKAVKDTKKSSGRNALQIYKQGRSMMVNCGGTSWYPVRGVTKIITCKNRVMRFERRYQQNIRVCDDYTCQRVKM